MKKPRDFQRKAVYAWEHSKFTAVSKIELTIEECRSLVNDASYCYGVFPPEVIYPDYEGQRAYYQTVKQQLVFPKWSRHRHYVWHELAHYIHHVKHCDGAIHGEKFFSIYSYLLNQYGCYPMNEIFLQASKLGIKYSEDFPKFTEGKPNPSLVIPYS
jgi:hypothetical protein